MKEIAKWLSANDNYLILTHLHPDGDTVGSAIALCLGLRSLGKTCYIAPITKEAVKLSAYTKNVEMPDSYSPEHLISVDTSTKERLLAPFANSDHVELSLDHHLSTNQYARLYYSDPTAAATGEIIFDLLKLLGIPLTKEIAIALYLAIATDTGCFRHSNTTAKSHAITAELLGTGIDPVPLIEEFFVKTTRARQMLETYIYSHTDFFGDGKIAVSLLPLSVVTEIGATEDDMASLSALTRRIENVELGILLREEATDVKVSVRSSQEYRADLLAAHLGGGGHARAAGTMTSLPLESAYAQIRHIIENDLES